MASMNAFHSTNLFGCSCFSRYQALTNSVALSFCIQLFRQRLSHTSVKANATMPISIMGSDSLVKLTIGSLRKPRRQRQRERR